MTKLTRSSGKSPDEPDRVRGGELFVQGLPISDAFEVFYREHLPFVRHFLARRVDNPFVVADLTAEVFLQVIRSSTAYRCELGPPRAWLVGMVQRIAAEGDARVLLASIARLPTALRSVVELVAVDGLPLVEAAAVLDISPGAARVRYHRARRLLRNASNAHLHEVTP